MAKTTKKEIQAVMEERISNLDSALEGLKIGSEEYSRVIRDMSNLANSVSEMRKVTIQKEDNESKRDEQKRMNDYEMEYKENQLKIECARLDIERLHKERQNKLSIIDCIREGATSGLSWLGYALMANRSYKAEYLISDGASKQLPSNVNKTLLGMAPKKKF